MDDSSGLWLAASLSVFPEGGPVRRGDQEPEQQTEGGEKLKQCSELFTCRFPVYLTTSGLFPVCLLTLLTCWLPVYLVYLLILFLLTFCLPAHLFYIAASCLPFNFLFTRSPPVFQAETRAEFSERSVAKLEKTIDGLEGESDVFWWLLVKLHLCR